jgi:hypothetical protein
LRRLCGFGIDFGEVAQNGFDRTVEAINLKFTGRRSGLRAWRGLPDGVGQASTVARDRTRTRRLRARGQRRTGFEDFRIGGHRGVPGQARVSEVLSG